MLRVAFLKTLERNRGLEEQVVGIVVVDANRVCKAACREEVSAYYVGKQEEVVVRAYPTDAHGTYLAVINTGMHPADNVTVTLPGNAADSGGVVVPATFSSCAALWESSFSRSLYAPPTLSASPRSLRLNGIL